jgi:hypothetical protein
VASIGWVPAEDVAGLKEECRQATEESSSVSSSVAMQQGQQQGAAESSNVLRRSYEKGDRLNAQAAHRLYSSQDRTFTQSNGNNSAGASNSSKGSKATVSTPPFQPVVC